MPIVAEMSAYRFRYVDDVRELLLDAWPKRGGARARLRPVLGHALAFGTWQSLVRREGCAADEAVRLMVAFVEAAAR
jgi:hypothetical protein